MDKASSYQLITYNHEKNNMKIRKVMLKIQNNVKFHYL